MYTISVVGLGKLGACAASCFAYKGFQTIGVDIDQALVDSINRGIAPVPEPKLQDLINQARDNLRATRDYRLAFEESDITFLLVPTPSKKNGQFSNRYIKSALTGLSLAFKSSLKKYHLFVITSTVSPGSSQGELIPLIEAVSGKKLNRDFGFCYNPEFIALGSVIDDTMNPDMVLIGKSNSRAGDQLESIYRELCENDPHIARMSIISAEITKISLNAYVTMKISFANTLANISEKIPGTEIDKITSALGADNRISPYYLKGGPAYGGPCFPRDNLAFAEFMDRFGMEAKLATATHEVNKYQIHHLKNKIMATIGKTQNQALSILGLTYKPDTPVMEESPAMPIIKELLNTGCDVIVYDPLGMDNARAIFGDDISYAKSIKECLSNSSLCIITTNDKAFVNMDVEIFKGKPITVIDCWRILPRLKACNNVRYIAIGEHAQALGE